MKKVSYVLYAVISIALIFSAACKKKELKIPEGATKIDVTFVSPKGESFKPGNIVATFNAPMVSISTIGKMVKYGPFEVSPEVSGSFHWLGTKTVSFTPEKPFPFATKYFVKMKGDITNIYGGQLKEPFTWDFETARPDILASKPQTGERGVALNENILLEFNQPINPSTALKHLGITATAIDGTRKEIKFTIGHPSEKQWKEDFGRKINTIENAVIIFPKENLPFSSAIEISIDANMTGKEGDLSAGKQIQVVFNTIEPLKIVKLDCVKKCNPRAPIQIEFNNDVIPKEAIKFISISPDVEIENTSDWETPMMTLFSKLEPSKEYELKVSAELQDIYGNKLGKEEKYKYSTGNFVPRISIVNGFGVLEANGPKEIPVVSVNVNTLNVESKVISTDETIPVINKNEIFFEEPLAGMFSPESMKEINISADINKEHFLPYNIDNLLNDSGKGIVLLDFSSPDVYYMEDTKTKHTHQRTLVQITDIGITGKFTDNGALIWTTSLSDGKPIEGVNITLKNEKNKSFWTGTTNAQGLAVANVKKPEDKDEYSPVYVFAEKNGDTAFSLSNWNSGFYAWDFGYQESYKGASTKGFLFTERGIYKPGETIRFKAIVRNLKEGVLTTPKAKKAILTATDTRGKKFFESEFDFNEFGTLGAEIKIPAYVAAGYCNINLKVGEENGKETDYKYFDKSVNIAEYKPAEFKVLLTPESNDYVSGEKINVNVEADYLFGEPMKDNDVTWSVFKYDTDFRPKNYDKYFFGLMFDDDVQPEHDGFMELAGKTIGKLNSSGTINFTVPTKIGATTKTTNYVIESTVTDINKTSISDRAAVTVHPGEFYIGINTDFYINTSGKPFDISIVGTKIDGKPALRKDVTVSLLKREWHTAKKKAVVGFTYETKAVDTEVASCKIETKDEAVKCTLTGKTSGMHIVKATSTDGKGNHVASSIGLYLTGTGEAAWKPEDHDRIEIVSDKKEYAPGEKAKILIKSPFESSQALITYEREGIIKQETRELEGYAPTIEIPIAETYMPNIYISVILVRGRISETVSENGNDQGCPAVKVGYVNLPVSAESKKLKVSVLADKNEAKPGDTINVKLQISDRDGKPVKGELAVMAVDTGSLILTGFKTPDPFHIFYAEAGLGVSTSDSRIHVIGRRKYGLKGESSGGGGSEGSDTLRTKFLPVAYWNPSVVTEENGEASISFTLPDNLTTFKIMAVANTTDKFGNGHTEIVSKKPFMLRASLPYFAALGDEFKTGVVLQNNTDKVLSGEVTAGASGITIKGDDTKEFKVSPKNKSEIFFTFRALEEGNASLTFKAESNFGSDGLTLPLAIKVTHPKEAFTSYGESETTAKEIIAPLENIYPNIGGLDLSVSATAMNGLEDSSLYLINYPYECTEQKTSKGIGMLIYSKILEALNIEKKEAQDYDSKVKEIAFKLASLQNWNGSFSVWPGLLENPYVSTYATHFFTLAKQSGANIPDDTYLKAKNYIKEILRWNAKEKSYHEDYLNMVKAYALYVLSLAGEPEAQYHENIYLVRDKLPISALAQLMIAMKKEGSPAARFEEFLRFVDNNLIVTAAEAHIEEKTQSQTAMRSNFYTNAYVIMALLQIRPDHPHIDKMARYLMNSSKKGYWESTHTTAAVLSALYEYTNVKEKTDPNFKVTVKLGAKEIENAKFGDRSAKPLEAKITTKELLDITKPTELLFEKDGPGLMYFRTSLTYASKESPLPPMEEGFTIHKTILPYDKIKKGKRFERGDVVIVRLEFVLPSARQYVVINDWLPAGLEAVNFSLSTAQKSLALSSPQTMRLDHIETYGDRVLIFANVLPAGAYKFEYIAKAATKGEFSVPPAQIEEMYNPQVFGRSMTGEIEIE